ncbi:unnamed protein product [Moneuplotes crassus]|uniref:Uncharacterized protein n=1 Tax=Euplotes crassus TaxID=5936 RepID=A0AAD2D4C1_EUPCR|nr:unnamed protein product [Moneuplotes crassus]
MGQDQEEDRIGKKSASDGSIREHFGRFGQRDWKEKPSFEFDQRFLDSMSRLFKGMRFPDSYGVSVDDLFMIRKSEREYMHKLFPRKIEDLSILSNGYQEFSIKTLLISKYLFFEMSSLQFRKLLSACRHIKILHYGGCHISVPTKIDFCKSLKNCKIKELYLPTICDDELNNIIILDKQVGNLLKGVAACEDLTNSLEILSIGNYELYPCEVNDILEKYGLECLKWDTSV